MRRGKHVSFNFITLWKVARNGGKKTWTLLVLPLTATRIHNLPLHCAIYTRGCVKDRWAKFPDKQSLFFCINCMYTFSHLHISSLACIKRDSDGVIQGQTRNLCYFKKLSVSVGRRHSPSRFPVWNFGYLNISQLLSLSDSHSKTSPRRIIKSGLAAPPVQRKTDPRR